MTTSRSRARSGARQTRMACGHEREVGAKPEGTPEPTLTFMALPAATTPCSASGIRIHAQLTQANRFSNIPAPGVAAMGGLAAGGRRVEHAISVVDSHPTRPG